MNFSQFFFAFCLYGKYSMCLRFWHWQCWLVLNNFDDVDNLRYLDNMFQSCGFFSNWFLLHTRTMSFDMSDGSRHILYMPVQACIFSICLTNVPLLTKKVGYCNCNSIKIIFFLFFFHDELLFCLWIFDWKHESWTYSGL